MSDESRAAVVQQMIAYQEAKGISGLKHVGSLLWTTIPDLMVTPEAMRASFVAHGLDPKWLPGEPNPRDAFRHAMERCEMRRIALDKANARFLNVLPRPMPDKPDLISFQLVEEEVDGSNRRLQYAPFARVELVGQWVKKKAELPQLKIERIDPNKPLHEAEQKVLEQIPDLWHFHMTHHGSEAVRLAVAYTLKNSDRVSVRPSGGVFFVPIHYQPRVEGLEAFLKEMGLWSTNSDSRCELSWVPVVNGKNECRMVEMSLREQVKGESAALVHEMQQLLAQGRKVRQSTADGYLMRVVELTELCGRYKDLLDVEMAETFAGLEIASAQVRDLRQALVA